MLTPVFRGVGMGFSPQSMATAADRCGHGAPFRLNNCVALVLAAAAVLPSVISANLDLEFSHP